MRRYAAGTERYRGKRMEKKAEKHPDDSASLLFAGAIARRVGIITDPRAGDRPGRGQAAPRPDGYNRHSVSFVLSIYVSAHTLPFCIFGQVARYSPPIESPVASDISRTIQDRCPTDRTARLFPDALFRADYFDRSPGSSSSRLDRRSNRICKQARNAYAWKIKHSFVWYEKDNNTTSSFRHLID